jgi:hypothetical protein
LPFIAAAGVRFSEAQNVTQLEVDRWGHDGVPSKQRQT